MTDALDNKCLLQGRGFANSENSFILCSLGNVYINGYETTITTLRSVRLMSSRFLHTDRLQLKVIERQKKLAKFDRAVDSANYIFSRCYTNSDGSARYVNPMQCTAQAIVVGYYDRDPRPRCACLLYFDIDKACEMWTFCAWPMQMVRYYQACIACKYVLTNHRVFRAGQRA
jgi:hypothetical protein